MILCGIRNDYSSLAHVISPSSPRRDYLIDVSRLVWRYWSRRLPTGIDRVCLAYLEHFGGRAQAVVQRNGMHFILSRSASERLFRVLLSREPVSRLRLIRALATGVVRLRRKPRRADLLYLNVGHTGLNEPSLPGWISANRLRAIYMVHDLIPLTHPQYCRSQEAEKHARRMDNVLTSAAGVIGNSRATLDELADYAATKGLPMPPAVAAWISGPPPRGCVGTPPLAKPYFVILGTIEGRKNHQLLLDVWEQLVAERGDEAPVLVVIGQRGWEAEIALARLDRIADFNGCVLRFDRCGDDELATWLGGARALLMPSFTEGFGLPVIEALQLGTPVIASDLPVFREIAGDIPAFLEPGDAKAWRRAIESLVDGESERARQVSAMRSYRTPIWTDHFAIVDSWLETL